VARWRRQAGQHDVCRGRSQGRRERVAERGRGRRKRRRNRRYGRRGVYRGGQGRGRRAFAPLVDLWDNGWPEHRYYYTVVPVAILDLDQDNKLEYWDTELPQDVCAAGRVFTFGKLSEAVVATAGAAPYVSGLSTTGRLFTASRARPSVYGVPLVAWKPALGADRYEVQWSKRAYPWAKAGSLGTPSTSATLPLGRGRWHYRVRGISLALPAGGRQMSWSDPIAIRVAKPVFKILR
jgi:hypothetical protein